MRRRQFIAGLGSAAAWPLATRAQQTLPVIGFLHGEAPDLFASRVRAFLQGLSEAGYVVGRNVAIEYRWAEGQNDRLPALAANLVLSKVAVICTPGSTVSAIAAKAATQTIPIVFMVGTDPVQIGLVASLSHPGGNLTGINNLTIEVAAKRLGVLHELLPAATSLGLLVNSANRLNAEGQTTETQQAARSLGVDLLVLNASSPSEIEGAFARLVGQRAGGLSISGDALFAAQYHQIIALAARHKMPTIHQSRDFATAGGLMSYGPNPFDGWRQVGSYAGRILKGEKPADLPVERSTRVEFVINLKTAKSLGLTIPETLLATADEVIQ
jgi:putative tryptophan/tyrosine transport system substrate-binding protein